MKDDGCRCPECKSGTYVWRSRKRDGYVERIRKCLKCDTLGYYTHERLTGEKNELRATDMADPPTDVAHPRNGS